MVIGERGGLAKGVAEDGFSALLIYNERVRLFQKIIKLHLQTKSIGVEGPID